MDSRAYTKYKSFVSIDVLCTTPQTIELRNFIKQWQRTHKILHKEFMGLLKTKAYITTVEHRQEVLNRVISSIKSHPIVSTFHEFNEIEQDQIDSILLDQRCRTGMKIMKLTEAVTATEVDEIPPHEIVDFLQDFVDQTASEFHLPDEHLDKLRLCVGRAVYPVLFNHLWNFQKEKNAEADALFESQQSWLRLILPSQLDPVLAPFDSNLELFRTGADILENLSFYIVCIFIII